MEIKEDFKFQALELLTRNRQEGWKERQHQIHTRAEAAPPRAFVNVGVSSTPQLNDVPLARSTIIGTDSALIGGFNSASFFALSIARKMFLLALLALGRGYDE